MTFQGVPFAVGGGAKVPVEAGRLVGWVATRGARGVVLPGDCVVKASDVPDGNVNVQGGGVVIPNGAVGTSAETYLGKNLGAHPVPITATGAGEIRSDLVYVNVADPQYDEQPDPVSILNGPYIAPVVCSGVLPSTETVQDAIDQGLLPAGTTGLELCRVDMPESTGTVTDAMITDLRRLANPRQERATHIIFTQPGLTLTSPTYVTWPDAPWGVAVPEWATRARVLIDVSQVVHWAGNITGFLRINFGGIAGPNVGYDLDLDSGAERTAFKLAADIALPEAMRGTTQTITTEGLRSTGTGYLESYGSSIVVFDVEFYQSPEG